MKFLEKRYIGLYLFSIMIIVLILAFSIDKDVPVGKDYNVKKVSTDWSYERAKYENENGRSILQLTMTRLLSDDIKGKTLSFKTYDSYVNAYLSDKPNVHSGDLVYHFGEKPIFGDSPGTYTHFIHIPDEGGKYLNIVVDTVYPHKYMESYQVLSAEENELVYYYLKKEFNLSLMNIIMVVFGILLMVIHLVGSFKKINAPEAFSLGALSLLFAVYSNCPLFFNQFICCNPVAQYYMIYFSLYMLPLAAIQYFEDIVPTLNLKWLFYGFLVLELGLSAVHFTEIASYTRTVVIFTAALGAFAIITTFLIIQRFRLIEPEYRIGLLCLLGFAFANVVFYLFVSTVGDQSFIIRIGFIIYLAFEIVNGLRKIMNEVNRERETQLLHTLAYTDQLTGLGNRYALERDAESIPLENISVMSMDLNLLKTTNDSFGHFGGDMLLVSAAKCMLSVFDKVYRVGGDEFIALLSDKSEEELKELHATLHDMMDKMNIDRSEYGEFAYEKEFFLSIAVGYASFIEGDEDFERILSRADKAMYDEKNRMHSNTVPISNK
ncbi:GGDEF domain-containing protein [Ruminococcus albus]|uniref:Diguanylate cyclase (GGDEF) domain-containing protein n=1 Tax=Ruminococcus albus TaxID=1264 RepID=A0A1H7IPM5_RUMAL|nr:GGDEF domain-containing protein [Ruminococcus albus]SEK64429.1 diguanylate cyclase (GGDEF) domain-containing protein [Ruminococcus albus]